ncbi:ecto-ADP-ribosyltransferase 5-like [Lissotriton helveticus]
MGHLQTVVRGQCIATASGVRRTLLEDITREDEKLRVLERARPERPDAHEALLEARETVAVTVERLRCFDNKAYLTRAHSERDKTGALLAWLADPARRSSVILELRDHSGVARFDQQGINETFYDYYTELYRSRVLPSVDEFQGFLEGLDLPELGEEDAKRLGSKIEEREANVIMLDMVPNSFDDQYDGCADKMEERIITEGLLEKELSRNIPLRQQWNSATQEWARRKNSGTLPRLPRGFKDEYGVALMAYTGSGIYTQFNAAVREGGQSTAHYMNNFHFKSFHFYLTRAFQLLKESCKSHPNDVYRGVTVQFSPPKGSDKKMRFGQFTSTSLDKKIAEEFGLDSFFAIRSCFGVHIQKYSFYPDQAEVLIPASEVFTVTKYMEQGHRFVLNSTQEACSKYKCAYLDGKKAKSSFPYCIYNSAPGGDNKFLLPLLFSGFLMIRAGVLIIFSIN